MSQSPWEAIVARKREQVAAALPAEWRLPQHLLDEIRQDPTANVLGVPAECGLLTPREIEITQDHDAVALVAKLASNRFTASEVTTAFCKRAAIATQLTNCVTEMFFDTAHERAKYLDDYMERNGKPIGPLHGLPISLKDSFNVKGTFSTIGYVSFIKEEPADFDSTLVKILLSLGAVLYVKTNVPQTMIVCETTNNIFGRCLNPLNLSLTSGGSSGGEAALLAMHGSALGVGTDIGGSLRAPSLCCGIIGFKTSTARLPLEGNTAPVRLGMPGIPPVVGPMTRSVRDTRLFLESVMAMKPWEVDSGTRGMPWRDEVELRREGRKLRIGLILECKSYPVSNEIKRGLGEAAQKLKAAGHGVAVVEKFPSFFQAAMLSQQLLDLDNDLTSFKKFIDESGEPVIQEILDMHGPFMKDRKPMTLEKLFDLNLAQYGTRIQWHKIFSQGQFDVLLCPGHKETAPAHGKYGLPVYTIMWNLIESPAAVIPYYLKDRNGKTEGIPCHLQIVGRREQDEEMLAAIELIEKAVSD